MVSTKLSILALLSHYSQIYTVRTLRSGEHETFRVKPSDLKKILVVRCLLQVPF